MAKIADTPASALEEIRRRGLPDVFSKVWDDTLPGFLELEWQRPDAYFSVCHDLVKNVPGVEGLCPLWEQNGEAIVGCLPNEKYIRLYYEDAGPGNSEASIEILGANYQQFVTSVLVELIDSGLLHEFDEVAALLSYKYTKELRALLDAYTDEHGEAELARFRAAVR